MATLAVDKPRPKQLGELSDIPVIASEIIYEGAAVGIVSGTGHARPLAAGDRFGGFCMARLDNSLGAAAEKNIKVIASGKVQLAVTGAVITDVGQPVYATDDDVFAFSPVSSVFIGFIDRFVSSGVAIVAFDALNYRDPYGDRSVREVKSANYTIDAEDNGKLIWVDTDAFTLTLPAIAAGAGGFKIVNGGAFGAVAVTISPDAADMILGPDITGANDKDLINTKVTAKRGDYVVLSGNDADGYAVYESRGTWARQA